MKTLRFAYLWAFALLVALTAGRSMEASQTARRPNILLAISDDHSFPHASAYGAKWVRTPAFDRVAREGMLFTNAFVASPGCSPSRAALLTGRHTWQLEEAGTHASSFPSRYVVYPDLLEQSGYFIGYTGKGWGPGNWNAGGRTRNPAGPEFNQHESATLQGISSADYAANFKDFLRAKPEKAPFCFWYGGREPHRGYKPGIGLESGKKLEDIEVPPFLPDTPEVRSDLLDYAIEIEWFDQHLGRMLQMLEEAGELENTLVVVTGDNGLPFPRAKANLYEYGIHVPLAIRWPTAIPGRRVIDSPVSLVDLAPTFLEAAGVQHPGTHPMVGQSLIGLLTSGAAASESSGRAVFSARERHSSSRYNNLGYPGRALRTSDYLYIRNFKPERWPAGAPQKYEESGELGPVHGAYHDIDASPTVSFLVANREDPPISRYFHLAVDKRPAEELYDIRKDPGCLTNLADLTEYFEVKQRLAKALEQYLTETGDPRAGENGEIFESYPRYSPIRKFPAPEERERVSVTPDHAVAGEFGTWTVTYRVGPEGFKKGAGIRVQLPDSWHSGIRNSAKRLQATDPASDHFISARPSRDDVRLRTTVESEPEAAEWLVKDARKSLDGRMERYVFVVRVEVVEGELREGDALSVIYGDTSGGSRGIQAAIIATPPEPVLVALDADGTGNFKLLADRPTMEAYGGQATELMVIGPSHLDIGRPAQLRFSVVDANDNPARGFEDEIFLDITADQIGGPTKVSFNKDQPWQVITVTPRREGVFRIRASARKSGLTATSNPMKVFAQEAQRKIYWGDLHSHTKYSWDGVGEGNFEYARDITGLDFYAMTDHSRSTRDGFTQGLGKHVWEEYCRLVDDYYKPREFVTIHAYEASFGSPYGHHNVYFRSRPGPLLSSEAITLPELWKALTAKQALTIPHHTGKMPRTVEWSQHDPELRRNFEIYSAHGLSEAYDPIHPLAFEQSLFTAPARSSPGPSFAQDAWIYGLVLSTIAASDDHRAHPGQPHWGLAAVAATGLTREEIFDALYERRTYGTTGARILLDFSINGVAMGEQGSAQGPVRLKVEAHGTGTIELLEVLRYSRSDQKFQVLFSFNPGRLDFQWEGADESFREDSIYYVRLRQAGFIRDRIAMAWSSPIWIQK